MKVAVLILRRLILAGLSRRFVVDEHAQSNDEAHRTWHHHGNVSNFHEGSQVQAWCSDVM
jgi:hypothetical protein